jgi:hypothetical protein
MWYVVAVIVIGLLVGIAAIAECEIHEYRKEMEDENN